MKNLILKLVLIFFGLIPFSAWAEIWVNTPDALYSYRPLNKVLKKVMDISRYLDIAVSPSGAIYGVDGNGSLMKINLKLGTTTLVHSFQDQPRGLAFTKDGKIVSCGNMFELIEMDLVTGDLKRIGDGPPCAGDIIEMPDGYLYQDTTSNAVGGGASNGWDTVLIKMNRKTGAVEVLGVTGFNYIYGLAQSQGVLYGFTGRGEVILLDTKTGKGTLYDKYPVSFWGAASDF